MRIGSDHSPVNTMLGQHSSKRNREDPICFSLHLYRARNLVDTKIATQVNKLRYWRKAAA